MSRVQLALKVKDVAASVDFYERFFGVGPDRLQAGYANFTIDEPPLKLVLIEGEEGGGTLDHLGVEVESTTEVTAAGARLADAGLATVVEEGVECCYARQDKVWVTAPDGEPWEFYTVLGESPVMSQAKCC